MAAKKKAQKKKAAKPKSPKKTAAQRQMQHVGRKIESLTALIEELCVDQPDQVVINALAQVSVRRCLTADLAIASFTGIVGAHIESSARELLKGKKLRKE